MSKYASTLKILMRLDQITRPNLLLIKSITKSKPLGRWCHKGYNDICDTDRKIDLANMDNSFASDALKISQKLSNVKLK